MPTTQTSRDEDDYKHSYLLFLSHGHNFELFLIQITDPVNEIPQCPAKCTLSCVPWHLGTFHNWPSTHKAGSASQPFGPYCHSDHKELILPSTLYSRRRRKEQKATFHPLLSILNLGVFPSAHSGVPNPMFFSRSAGNLGLEASLKLIFFGEREERWRKGRREGTGDGGGGKRETYMNWSNMNWKKTTSMDPENPGLKEVG